MAAISVEALNSFLFPDTAVYLFTSQTAPKILGTAGITPFINHLASVRNVATSTQAQALSALIFLCRDVLEVDVGHLAGLESDSKNIPDSGCLDGGGSSRSIKEPLINPLF